MAKDLFEIIGQVIGRSTRATLSLKSNFYQLGGNSLNSVYTVAQLRSRGYFIGITDFIRAKTLCDILNALCVDGKSEPDGSNGNQKDNFKASPLVMAYKSEVIECVPLESVNFIISSYIKKKKHFSQIDDHQLLRKS